MSALPGMQLKTATLRGLKTAWLDNGREDKDILLFLHGYPDTPETWSAQAAAFGDRYRVLIPYARGVGPSEAPSDRKRYGATSTLLDHLEILRLTDPEGLRPLHVVGHDVGGGHAWMLASHPSPRLKTVSLLNTAHPWQYLKRFWWPRQLFKSWYVGAFQLPLLPEAVLWVYHKRIMRALEAEGWRPPQGKLALEDFQGAIINAMNQYRRFTRDLPAYLRERAALIEIPALEIATENDPYLERPMAPEYTDIARNVTIRVVQGKHWLHREQPERVNRLLENFWKEHS